MKRNEMKLPERQTPEFRNRVGKHYSRHLSLIRDERGTTTDPAHAEACNMLLKLLECSFFEAE